MNRWTMHCWPMMTMILFAAGGVRAQEGEQPDSLEEADQAIADALAADEKKPEAEATAEAPAAAREDEDKLRFSSSAPGGEAGLLRVREAGSSAPGTIRVGFHGGFFTSSGGDGFLNYLGEDGYDQSQVVGKLSLSYTPLPFLEAFVSLRSSSNKNSVSRPSLLQTQGDLELGAKGFYPVTPFLALGLDFGVGFYNGIGEVTPDFSGTSLRTSALVSFDARGIDEQVPLRVHVNGGMIFENTDNLEGNRDLTYIEQYALRVNSYHRVNLGFGIDAPLPYADPVAITPFIEYNVQIPVGLGDDELATGSLGEDTTLANVVPMTLTPGVRVTYLRDITLDVAVDIGIGGEKAYLDGVPSTPPYMVWLGLTYTFDPTKRGEEKIVQTIVEREKIVEKVVAPPVTTGRIKGRVLNALDQQHIPHAIVSFNGSGITPVASDELEGKYETYDLTAGIVKLTAVKKGFKAVTQEAEVKAGEVTLLDFTLEPDARLGTISGTVFDDKDAPLVARIDIQGPQQLDLRTAKDTGAFASEVPAGSYVVKASADGYLAKARRFDLKENETVMAEFKLRPEPPTRVVILEKDKIRVKKKIHFASGKAEIRADSFAILDGVIDVLANHPEIEKLRIAGHTDSVGSNRLNERLSQERADAVREYLVEQGIPADALEAKGYGESKPIAPNSTRRGREQNRRVEFLILEQ